MSQYIRYPQNGTSLPSGATGNQILGENAAGTALEWKTLQGTVSQVVVTNGVGTITLSLPQDIAATSSPTFNDLTLTDDLLFSGAGSVIGAPSSNRPTAIYSRDHVYVGDFSTESSAGLNSNALTSGFAGLVLKTATENFFDLYQKGDSHIYMAWEGTDHFRFENDGDLAILTGDLLFPGGGDIGLSGSNRPVNIFCSGDITLGGDLVVGDDATVVGDLGFTAQLLGAIGSAALPTYSFTVDPNNGLYLVSTDSPAISAAGIGVVRFQADSNKRRMTDPASSTSFIDFNGSNTNRMQIATAGNQLEMYVTNGSGQRFCYLGYDDGSVAPGVALYGAMRMSSTYRSTDNDIFWQTDGSGDVGQVGARPRDLRLSRNAHIAGYAQVTSNADPGAQTDSIAIGAQDVVASSLRTLSLRTEQAVAADVSLVSTNSIVVYINGVQYKIALTAV